jgi:hypothetical protein
MRAHSINLALTVPVDDVRPSLLLVPAPMSTNLPLQRTTFDPVSARAPSPAPTEIEDPDPESILEDLKALNIKARDYAYPAPVPASFPDSIPAPASTSRSGLKPPKVHIPAPLPAPATEIFDQYKGIVEFEYRLAQIPRSAPITGKTMRRLFDLDWVTMEEAQARLHPIDWAALKEYDTRHGIDARGKGKGKDSKEYPWRPCKWSTVPMMEERQRLVVERGQYFYGYDRVRRQLEHAAAREEKERMQAEEAEERMRLREHEMDLDVAAEASQSGTTSTSSSAIACPPPSPSRKRAFEASELSSSSASTSTDAADGDAKRQRLSSSPPAYPPAPSKQYPAPLSSYNPELYPEAASVIESQARPPPPRADTPPARSDTPPLGEDGEPEGGSHGGQPLVRRVRGLKRTLSRTQTFKQL